MCVCEHVRTREKRELVVRDGERQWEREWESERVVQVWKPSSRTSANTHLERDMSEGNGRGRHAGEECGRVWRAAGREQRKRAAHLTEAVEEVRESQPLVWGAGGGRKKGDFLDCDVTGWRPPLQSWPLTAQASPDPYHASGATALWSRLSLLQFELQLSCSLASLSPGCGEYLFQPSVLLR